MGEKILEEAHRMNRDQLLTVGDLEDFKAELLQTIQKIVLQIEQPRQWLRSKEVRKILNISAGTLQNFRINGTLSYSKLGTVTYYKQEEIMKHLDKNLTNAHE